MRSVSAAVAAAVMVALAPGGQAWADRGSIAFDEDVKVYEPNQDALISWDGAREILLLQTRIRTSKPTKLLEVLPLPTEPQVEKGDRRAFVEATRLINRRRPRAKAATPSLGAGYFDDGPPPAAVVTQTKTIGAHQINVVKVLREEGFVAWVVTFLHASGARSLRLPPAFLEVIQAYLRDGCRWFVFDVISIGRRLRRVAPIAYSFASPRLYYPLRISRLERGRTRVKLLLLTRQGVRFPTRAGQRTVAGKRRRLRCWREVAPFSVSSRQLKRISKASHALLAEGGARLSQWRCNGHPAGADFDLLGEEGPPRPRRRGRVRPGVKTPDAPPARWRRRPRPKSKSIGEDLANPFD